MRNAVKGCEKPLLDLRVTIDIEALLIWTYRQQKAHLVIGRGEGLAPQEANMDGVEVQASSTCGVAQIMRIGELGHRIVGSYSLGELHEDAEATHRAVGTWLQREVIQHASVGDRPDWMPGAVPILVARTDARGRPLRAYEPWDKSRHYGWCMLDCRLSQAQIDAKRLAYTLWHNKLVKLAVQLGRPGILRAHRVTGPAAPAKPWYRKGVDIAQPP